MSQISVSNDAIMEDRNVRLDAGSWSMLSNTFFMVGALGLLLTVIGLFSATKHAAAGLHIGAMIAIGLGLGGMFFTLVFHLTNSGWSTTVRRQFENIVWCLPVGMIFAAISVALNLYGGVGLASWKNQEVTQGGAEHLFHFKSSQFTWFADHWVLARLALYFVVWWFLRRMLWRHSTLQDENGDPALTSRVRFHSSYGMLLFAFTSTFFAFDWLMAVADYRFFSTMWGVYFFAGNLFSAVSLCILILAALGRAGKLRGLVTGEHLHDLSKLAFGFTVFWAYIAFSQYFLIWYANIPEETAFFIYRKEHWPLLTTTLVIGHFIIPFYILLWRPVRRSWVAMSFVALYLLVMHLLDIYWIIRPAVDLGSTAAHPTFEARSLAFEAAGIIGVLSVFMGVLVRRIAAGPLVPIKDPRLAEALRHKNFV